SRSAYSCSSASSDVGNDFRATPSASRLMDRQGARDPWRAPGVVEDGDTSPSRGRIMHCHRGVRNAGIIGLALCGSITACSLSQGPESHSWEEFRDRAARVVDGRTIYVVEWDMALTLDELRAYYDANVAHPDIGTASQESTVNVVAGHDDVWGGGGGLRLADCVSNDVGAD